MAINFPNSPVVGDLYRYGIRTWQWNGTAWQLQINPAFGYGDTSIPGNLTVTGSLTVNGATTTINSNTIVVDDKNIILGYVAGTTGLAATLTSGVATITLTTGTTAGMLVGQTVTKTSGTGVFGATPTILSVDSNTTLTLSVNHATSGDIVFSTGASTDVSANGGGISLAGTTTKTLNWVSANTAWTSSENFDIASGKTYKINGTDIISGTAAALSIGAATGTATLNNPTVVFGASGTVTLSYTNASTITYAGTSATTVNFHTGSSTTHNLAANSTSFTLGGTATSSLTANIFANATATGNTKTINIGTAGASGSTTTITLGPTAGTGTIALNGGVTISAGTATAAPIRLTSGGTALTTPLSGALEYTTDGAFLTTNPGSNTTGVGRGLITAPQMVFSLANSSAATTSTAVAAFAAANDVLSVLEPAKLYRFSGKYYAAATFTSGTTETIQLLFAFSNAATAIKYSYKTYNQTAGTTSIAAVGTGTAASAVTVSPAVTASINYVIEFEGYFTTHATSTSTLTPQFQMSTTGTSTVITAGSWFQVEKLGSSTTTLIAGNWA